MTAQETAGRSHFALIVIAKSATTIEELLGSCAAEPFLARLRMRLAGIASIDDRQPGNRPRGHHEFTRGHMARRERSHRRAAPAVRGTATLFRGPQRARADPGQSSLRSGMITHSLRPRAMVREATLVALRTR